MSCFGGKAITFVALEAVISVIGVEVDRRLLRLDRLDVAHRDVRVQLTDLWEFLQRQGVMCSPIEIYGEMELLRLLDRFFDRALCFAAEGYEQYVPLQD